MSYKNTHIAKVSNFTTTFFEPIRQEGVPVEKLLRRHHLNKFDLSDPESYIPMVVMYDFMHKTDQYMGAPGLMSILSADGAVEAMGEFAEELLTNPNFLNFLQEGIKYQEVIATNLRMHLKVMGPTARFSFVFIDQPSPGWEFADAINLIQIFEGFKFFGGPTWHPLELHVPGKSVKKIEHLLPKGEYPIKYGYPDYGIIFPTSMLYEVNPVFDEHCKPENFNLPDFSISCCIEKILQSYKPGVMGTLADMADYFNVSARTVRRMLKEEGNTFTELRERAVFLKSLDLLSTTSFKINEIAEFLGYSEAANFIRFFKGYSGVSPGTIRYQT